MFPRFLVGWALLAGVLLLGSVRVTQAAIDAERATLTGHLGARLYLAVVDAIEAAGVSEAVLERYASSYLRTAGFQLLTVEELRQAPGRPALTIDVEGLRLSPSDWYAFTIVVIFSQEAQLVATGERTTVASWHGLYCGAAGGSSLPAEVVRGLRTILDNFVHAWQVVNPRMRPTAPTVRATPPAAPGTANPVLEQVILVRQVQDRLRAAGFDPGPSDGSLGPRTWEALRWFQNAKGIVPTADLNDVTLRALGIR
jgi:hypothetical protein